ncbi:unnamed protein product [Vitrella brassicaformis CCMP3155]|uniref:Uncharacterized protein n=1 Tax=Vitrella brassicaformis (strain CCMP3155) TaxID=1169540 RepID=A0A0G4GA88_VITBC|nr:unnamed protein product [Vitrella brassicaformis CCMP3155]|eukprot:CEM25891.1 unnamed protein product [Vitrella brassicaformis CCMP3155]
MDKADVVAALLSIGLSHHISRQDNVLKTPLHAAAQVGNAAVTKLLVSAADSSTLALQDNREQTVLHLAATIGRPAIVPSIVEASKLSRELLLATNRDGSTALHLSIHGDFIDITRLLSRPDSINYKGFLEMTPLQYGVAKGRWMHVHAMLDVVVAARPPSLACLENADQHGRNVLAMAAHGHEAAVVERMAKFCRENRGMHVITARDKDDNSSLHFAASNGNEEMVRLLAAKDGMKSQNTIKKRTPLHEGAAFGNPSALKEMLKHADKEALLLRDSASQTALSVAAACGKSECIRLLANAAAAEGCPELLDIKDKDGDLPLHLALLHDCIDDDVILLLASEGRVKQQRKDGQTAFHLAVVNEDVLLVEELLKRFKGEALFIADERGRTPLDLAWTRFDPDMLRLLSPWAHSEAPLPEGPISSKQGGYGTYDSVAIPLGEGNFIRRIGRAAGLDDQYVRKILAGRPALAANEETRRRIAELEAVLRAAPVSPVEQEGSITIPSWLRRRKSQQDILDEGNSIGGHSFPLWEENDPDLIVRSHSDNEAFVDIGWDGNEGDFSLSKTQSRKF